MHVGSCLVFEGEPPALRGAASSAIERRLHLVPRYRQRLAFVPLQQGRPRVGRRPALQPPLPRAPHGAARAPGPRPSCKRLAGRLFSQELDRDKPLWEIWLVERPRRATASRSSPRPTTRWSTACPASTSPRSCSTPRPSRRPTPEPGAVDPAPRCPATPSCWPTRCSSARPCPARSRAACARWPAAPRQVLGRVRERPRRRRRHGLGRRRAPAEPAQRADRPAPALHLGATATSPSSRRSRTSSAARSTTSC